MIRPIQAETEALVAMRCHFEAVDRDKTLLKTELHRKLVLVTTTCGDSDYDLSVDSVYRHKRTHN